MGRWVVLFSQTGKEIADISEAIKRFPDLILSNRGDLNTVDFRIRDRVQLISKIPSVEDYNRYFKKEDIITLHGFLRILPEEICNSYAIYNGHPGLITEFPLLKGKDPQLKAFNMGLEYSGCVIHKVSPEVDCGEIQKNKKIEIKSLTLDEIYLYLRDVSLELWIEFLKEKLI